MTKPYGTDASGRPVDMIGQPIVPGRGSVPGVVITEKGNASMANAEKNGVYVLNGHRFRIKAGDPLPEGAEFQVVDAPVEERANDAAPENRAKKAAPENRSKKAD